MARFYGDIDGKVTRQGHAADGLSGHVRGWNVGGKVTMSTDGDRDTVMLQLTGGSNGACVPLVQIMADSDGALTVRVPVGATVERIS